MLLSVTEHELKLKTGTVQCPYLRCWHTCIGTCEDDVPQNLARLIDILNDHNSKKAFKVWCPHHTSPDPLEFIP
ncbi:hypothetical protein Dxin01_03689 [Deinococcus xinjiangensis]|uniref:Uncharacterized protein n=1 Tax=Deinococcus xinjiangensis TaxID=457454 RepID=A0ABP9VGM7_9DEIO